VTFPFLLFNIQVATFALDVPFNDTVSTNLLLHTCDGSTAVGTDLSLWSRCPDPWAFLRCGE